MSDNQYGGKLKVFTGNANPGLAANIVRHLGIELGDSNVGRFKDGEIGIKIGRPYAARTFSLFNQLMLRQMPTLWNYC